MSDDQWSRYFRPGTTPDRVRRELQSQAERERPARQRPTTSERDTFFGRIAEEAKRAESR